jgi:hypothetical protein
MPRQAKPKDNTLLEMAIVGYQSELGRISREDRRYQSATRSTRSGPAKGHGSHASGGDRNGTRGSGEAPHDQQGGPRQDRRRAESEMGGAEEATGATRQAGEAQEAEDVGGGVEGDQGSHEKAVGGLPQGQTGWGLS